MWPRTDPNLVQAQVWACRTFYSNQDNKFGPAGNLPAPVTLLAPNTRPRPHRHPAALPSAPAPHPNGWPRWPPFHTRPHYIFLGRSGLGRCPKLRAEWWDGVRGQDRLLCHQLRPLIVGFWALATYPHVQTCALVVSLGRREDTQWGVHTTV